MVSIRHLIRHIILEDYRWSKDYQFIETYTGQPDIYVWFSTTPMLKKIFTRHIRHHLNIYEHQDPAGIYAFPVQFVFNHFHNLNKNVFFSMPYITILRDVSKNKCIISDPITYQQALEILEKLFHIPSLTDQNVEKQVTHMLKNILRYHSHMNQQETSLVLKNFLSRSPSEYIDNKLFYKLTKLEDQFLKRTDETIQYASSDRQRIRWIRAGYDAIEDKNSIIYPSSNDEDAEKEQIIFLTEHSFDIVDRLERTNLKKSIQSTFPDEETSDDIISNQQRIPYFLRKTVAEMINNILGDKMYTITIDKDLIHQYGTYLKHFKTVQNVVNIGGSTADAQSIIGRGKTFDVQILAIKDISFKKNSTKEVEEYFIFDIGIFNARNQSLITSLTLKSHHYKNFDEFIRDIRKNLNIKHQ